MHGFVVDADHGHVGLVDLSQHVREIKQFVHRVVVANLHGVESSALEGGVYEAKRVLRAVAQVLLVHLGAALVAAPWRALWPGAEPGAIIDAPQVPNNMRPPRGTLALARPVVAAPPVARWRSR